MADATSQRSQVITIQQCLFGYKEGHRLLASSLQSPDAVASRLLVLSDLAPGLGTTAFHSYWTGVPLGDEQYYALMRTWPAPEKARPGCVWTHALLVSFADLARLVDLGTLAPYAMRPAAGRLFDYGTPISIADPSLRPGSSEHRVIPHGVALHVVRALYSSQSDGTLFDRPVTLDGTIFAVWSQQWPSLRRSFSFRTATSEFDTGPAGVRFDLRVVIGRDASARPSRLPTPAPEAWEASAVEDLGSVQPTAFRRFLWRYGSDVGGGRQRFRFLATIYLSTRTDRLSGTALEDTLLTVARTLPSPGDGRVLKGDLVSAGLSRHSHFPASDPLETLEFFVRHPEVEAFPAPGADAFRTTLQGLWSHRADDVLSLAERAAERTSKLGDMLLNQLARVVESEALLKSTEGRPTLRHRLIESNPSLLDTDYLPGIAQPELSGLLALIPDNEDLASRVIRRLITRDDRQVIDDLFGRFPDGSLRLVVEAIEHSVEGSAELSPSLLEAVAARTAMFLGGGFVEAARSTKTLAALASLLRHDSPDVLRAGPTAWVTALRSARDDVHGHDRQVFLAFLLALALSDRTPGCEPLFERAFETIHTDLSRSTLPHEGSRILFRYLPDLPWWQQWDDCLRLRLAIVTAYVESDLDPASFKRLTSDPSLRNRLVQLADQTERGRHFISKMDVSRSRGRKARSSSGS